MFFNSRTDPKFGVRFSIIPLLNCNLTWSNTNNTQLPSGSSLSECCWFARQLFHFGHLPVFKILGIIVKIVQKIINKRVTLFRPQFIIRIQRERSFFGTKLRSIVWEYFLGLTTSRTIFGVHTRPLLWFYGDMDDDTAFHRYVLLLVLIQEHTLYVMQVIPWLVGHSTQLHVHL